MTVLSTLCRFPHFLSIRKMASAVCTCDFKKAKLRFILDDGLQDFPNNQVLRKEQEICLVNLARGKDVFTILQTSFGKSLIFQLFPQTKPNNGIYNTQNNQQTCAQTVTTESCGARTKKGGLYLHIELKRHTVSTSIELMQETLERL